MSGPFLTLELVFDERVTTEQLVELFSLLETEDLNFQGRELADPTEILHWPTRTQFKENILKNKKLLKQDAPIIPDLYLTVSGIGYTITTPNPRTILIYAGNRVYDLKNYRYSGFESICATSTKLKKLAHALGGQDQERPFFEYHRNAYYFSVTAYWKHYHHPHHWTWQDTQKQRQSYQKDIVPQTIYALPPESLEWPWARATIEEARRVLLLRDLKAVLEKHVKRLQSVGAGLAIWRYSLSDINLKNSRIDLRRNYLDQLSPAFFVRKAVRERGGQLYYGPTEEELALSLFNLRNALAAEGVISRELAEKLEKGVPKTLEFNEQRLKTLSLLTPEEKHELGLDLPKPPKELLKRESG